MRKSAQSGLCDTESGRLRASFFSLRSTPFGTLSAPHRQHDEETSILSVCDQRKKICAFSRCFFHARFPCAPCAAWWVTRGEVWTPPPSPERAGGGPKKNCGQVLTPRKTVIRFRPKQSMLRKRVSRINTTARETTQPIVTRIGVDAGLASPGKTQRTQSKTPVSPGDAGVFVFVGSRVSHARSPGESASPRVSRRRLPTGPTPAAFLAAGPASGQMCCNQT